VRRFHTKALYDLPKLPAGQRQNVAGAKKEADNGADTGDAMKV
jgi:hypothetical protein